MWYICWNVRGQGCGRGAARTFMQKQFIKIDSHFENKTCSQIKIVSKSRFRWKAPENNGLEFIAVLKVRATPQSNLDPKLLRCFSSPVFSEEIPLYPLTAISNAIKNLINL